MEAFPKIDCTRFHFQNQSYQLNMVCNTPKRSTPNPEKPRRTYPDPDPTPTPNPELVHPDPDPEESNVENPDFRGLPSRACNTPKNNQNMNDDKN